MAERSPTIACEDVPLDEARRMSRRPRMDREFSHALKQNIQSLSTTATRMPLPEGVSRTTMKNCMLRVAAERNIPVTARKVPGGLLFWRLTGEDLAQATGVMARLQPARPPQSATRRGRRRRAKPGAPPTYGFPRGRLSDDAPPHL